MVLSPCSAVLGPVLFRQISREQITLSGFGLLMGTARGSMISSRGPFLAPALLASTASLVPGRATGLRGRPPRMPVMAAKAVLASLLLVTSAGGAVLALHHPPHLQTSLPFPG